MENSSKWWIGMLVVLVAILLVARFVSVRSAVDECQIKCQGNVVCDVLCEQRHGRFWSF